MSAATGQTVKPDQTSARSASSIARVKTVHEREGTRRSEEMNAAEESEGGSQEAERAR